LNKPKKTIKDLESRFLRGASLTILVFALAMPSPSMCKAGEKAKSNALQKAAQQWMHVGKEQHERSLFRAAEKSFRRAAVYRRYLNDSDRKELDELLEKSANAALARELTRPRRVGTNKTDKPLQPVHPGETAKVVPLDTNGVEVKLPPRIVEPKADSIKEGKLLTKKEWEYINEKPISSSSSFAEQIGLPTKAKQLGKTGPSYKTTAGPRVTFAPGDEIEVKFFYTPELNITQTVRPDGNISLELIREVRAQGKTPAELRDELMRLYDPHLKAPEIAVVARSFYNQRVFVGGQVLRPGEVEIPGRMTALEAIMEVGGFDLRVAERKDVIVIRYSGDKRYAYKLNLKEATAGKETEPFYLQPKDIVYVPRTTIAKINQWIDQHINKIIPDTGFFFRKTSGDSAYGMGNYR